MRPILKQEVKWHRRNEVSEKNGNVRPSLPGEPTFNPLLIILSLPLLIPRGMFSLGEALVPLGLKAHVKGPPMQLNWLPVMPPERQWSTA
jgi:hypothetical protein